ncbi:MAG: TatD family hydrolase [Candidatus Pacebacteria bacterium]|nr:TatD family hydrolase [Candidatus Paceibacterota bacterium]
MNKMYIDSHAHLNVSEFDKTRNELIPSLLSSNIWIINVGVNYFSSEKAIHIAEKYSSGVFAAVGLHPSNIKSDFTIKKYGSDGQEENKLEEKFDCDKYKKLAKSPKVVAIGEVGLDYWTSPKGGEKKKEFKERQIKFFNQQLDLAEELNLPIIIHSRSSFDDTFDVVKTRKLKGVLHCFIGNKQDADRFLDLGYYIGLNGVIFKAKMDEFIKWVPLDRVLLETDCPYLTPPGFEGEVNNPFSLEIIANKIAKIKDTTIEEIKEKTAKNTRKLFKI